MKLSWTFYYNIHKKGPVCAVKDVWALEQTRMCDAAADECVWMYQREEVGFKGTLHRLRPSWRLPFCWCPHLISPWLLSRPLLRRFLFSPLLCPTLFYIHLQSSWTKPDFPAEASGCSCICAPDHSQLREATGGLSTVHCAFTARPNSPSFWGNSLNDLVEVDGYLGLKIAYLKVFYRNIVDLLQCCVEVAYQFR